MDTVIVTSPQQISYIIEEAIKKAFAEVGTKSEEASSNQTILTIDQASKFLNLAKQTLYGYTSNREIPFIKKGKKLYFRKQDLENWLSQGRKQTRDELGAALTKSIANKIVPKG